MPNTHLPLTTDRRMTALKRLLLPVTVAAATCCLPALSTAESVPALTVEARRAADSLIAMIKGELVQALETSGPLKGIVVCKYSVPELTSAMSRRTGWKVSRVSLRTRNAALGVPDAWEQAALLRFEERATRGEKADGMEVAEIVEEPAGRFFRYLRALPAEPVCATCHGPPATLSEAVKAQLAAEYPFDRGAAHDPGLVRGAVTVKRPLNP